MKIMRENIRKLSKQIFRKSVRLTRYPPVGMVKFGSFRRINPFSRAWGLDRGKPIDRYYIERFLTAHAVDVQGHVLEIGDNKYTLQFGRERVTKSDILHVSADYPKATVIADLTQASHVPSDTFDCIICTQTIHLIYDVQPAIETLCRLLKPGGVLLLTTPGISQISRYDMDRWGDYWRFTSASLTRLITAVFAPEHIQVTSYGNVLASAAFLYGLAAEELKEAEINHTDPDYEVTIAVRAKKPAITK